MAVTSEDPSKSKVRSVCCCHGFVGLILLENALYQVDSLQKGRVVNHDRRRFARVGEIKITSLCFIRASCLARRPKPLSPQR